MSNLEIQWKNWSQQKSFSKAILKEKNLFHLMNSITGNGESFNLLDIHKIFNIHDKTFQYRVNLIVHLFQNHFRTQSCSQVYWFTLFMIIIIMQTLLVITFLFTLLLPCYNIYTLNTFTATHWNDGWMFHLEKGKVKRNHLQDKNEKLLTTWW